MSGGELRTLILDAVKNEGGVALKELEIEVHGGTVEITGLLPSEAEHEILRTIIEDTLGIREIVDDVRIDRAVRLEQERTGPPESEEGGPGNMRQRMPSIP